ncbi:MAG: hypothetical protein ACREF5_00785 [Candidatus Saccharimonadales bacterium]
MSDTIFFQIFILIDVLIMGILATLAIQHASAHFRHTKHEPEKLHSPAAEAHLPAAIKEHLLQASQEQFQTVVKHSANLLQHDLEASAEQINNLVKRLATEIVSDELERYRKELSRLHNQAEIDMIGIKGELAGHEEELKAKMAQELEIEKKRLVQQIDTKLADAVGSFLLETLQHNIDLGSQTSYLISVLEEHKADFVKEVVDET